MHCADIRVRIVRENNCNYRRYLFFFARLLQCNLLVCPSRDLDTLKRRVKWYLMIKTARMSSFADKKKKRNDHTLASKVDYLKAMSLFLYSGQSQANGIHSIQDWQLLFFFFEWPTVRMDTFSLHFTLSWQIWNVRKMTRVDSGLRPVPTRS